MSFDLQQLVTNWTLLASRIGALLFYGPFFGSPAIPARVKAGITLILTAILFPFYGAGTMTSHPLELVGILLRETMIGLSLGLASQIVMEGAQFAGQIVGIQLGFSLVNILDPQSSVDTPVLSLFNQFLVLLIFLQLNIHHWMIRALIKSFDIPIVSGLRVSPETAQQLVKMCGRIFSIGVEVAAPIVAATVLIDVVFGLIGRIAPQVPVLFLGISVKSTVGLVILSSSLVLWPKLFGHYFDEALRTNALLIQTLVRR